MCLPVNGEVAQVILLYVNKSVVRNSLQLRKTSKNPSSLAMVGHLRLKKYSIAFLHIYYLILPPAQSQHL